MKAATLSPLRASAAGMSPQAWAPASSGMSCQSSGRALGNTERPRRLAGFEIVGLGLTGTTAEPRKVEAMYYRYFSENRADFRHIKIRQPLPGAEAMQASLEPELRGFDSCAKRRGTSDDAAGEHSETKNESTAELTNLDEVVLSRAPTRYRVCPDVRDTGHVMAADWRPRGLVSNCLSLSEPAAPKALTVDDAAPASVNSESRILRDEGSFETTIFASGVRRHRFSVRSPAQAPNWSQRI
ncbi:hypothetical protein SVAN01_08350 [Stagonosporopsis vannaccii]|nr:hypothetical protein SVAN01_08350 [Stagonosporopsis vannaccii]